MLGRECFQCNEIYYLTDEKEKMRKTPIERAENRQAPTNLDLHGLDGVLEDGEVGGDTVLAVVEEHDGTLGVEGLASVEL